MERDTSQQEGMSPDYQAPPFGSQLDEWDNTAGWNGDADRSAPQEKGDRPDAGEDEDAPYERTGQYL